MNKPAQNRRRTPTRKEKEEGVPSFEVYRNLVENSLDAMLLTDPSGAGRVLAANPEAGRMLGWPEEELVGSPRSAVFNMDDPRTAGMIEERLATGRFRGTVTFKRKDGSVFPAEASTILFRNSAGQTQGRDKHPRYQRARAHGRGVGKGTGRVGAPGPFEDRGVAGSVREGCKRRTPSEGRPKKSFTDVSRKSKRLSRTPRT